MKTATERRDIAEEIIRRVDTVSLMRCDEVRDIHQLAQAGEFDEIFADEQCLHPVE